MLEKCDTFLRLYSYASGQAATSLLTFTKYGEGTPYGCDHPSILDTSDGFYVLST